MTAFFWRRKLLKARQLHDRTDGVASMGYDERLSRYGSQRSWEPLEAAAEEPVRELSSTRHEPMQELSATEVTGLGLFEIDSRVLPAEGLPS